MSDQSTILSRRVTVSNLSLFAVLTGLLSFQGACVSSKKQTNTQQVAITDTPEIIAEKNIIQGGVVLPRAEAGQGVLWFPFVWSPVLANPEKGSGLNSVEFLHLRYPKLILRNTATKGEVLISLREESGLENGRFQLSLREPQKQLRFYLPRVLALSQGEYAVEGIRVELGTQGQDRGTPVSMPFVNPFQASATKPLLIQIREGRISTVARVVQTTSIAEAAQGMSLKTTSENLDNDVVPVGLVLRHLERAPADALSVVSQGTTDFPRLRFDLTNEQGESQAIEEFAAKIGFLVDAPCGAVGNVRLVLKRQNDEKEYLTQFPLNGGDANCKEKKTYPFSFLVPTGDWILKSTMISPSSTIQAQFQTPWLKEPSALLTKYFSLSESNYLWTLETQKEREIRKALILPVDSASRKFSELRRTKDVYRVGRADKSSDVLFLGHFDIRVSEAKNDRAALWDFVLKSGFDLQRTQTLLSSESLFNAYTLEKLQSGRSHNTNIILRTAADQEDRPSVAPVAAELQGEAKKAYASCVKEREESDPLVSLGGLLQFTVLKGSDSVNLRSQRVSSEVLRENWLELCLKKKLIGFRFSRKAPVNFQGELRFGKEN